MENSPNIVILPFAQQGHINPLMQLARKLTERGAAVTFVLSQNTVPSEEGKTPNLKIVGVDDKLPAERSRGSNFKDSIDSMVNMEAGFRDLLRQLCSKSPGVSALIYDSFMTWAPPIAASLSLPFICFFTSNATACALLYQVPTLVQRGILPFRRDGDENEPLPKHIIKGIDGVPDLLPEEFIFCLTFNPTHFRYKLLKSIGEGMRDATAIILNTIEELEPPAIATVRAYKPVYTVGPLLLLSGRPSRLDVNYWQEDDHCLHWLDSHAPSSVLYVSFGSVTSLPLSQFQQLALGLEASGHPFLWVVRPDSIDVPLEVALPDGFIARTNGQGLIITWGPQLLILSHPSIGGFLTHGGWNSIVENLSMGSVPMICWPDAAEQRLNRRLMVYHWKFGLGLQHEEDGSVTKVEIARVVHDLLQGEHCREVKEAASQLGNMFKKAVANEGSSLKNFEALYKYAVLQKDPASG